MVNRYRPLPSQKAILRRAVLIEELREFLERRIGLTWTEQDAQLTRAKVREIQALENVPN